VPIEGFASPEFQAVRREFERNFAARGERGAACAVYHRGAKVVDLWGGYRCVSTLAPWTPDTLVLVFSVSKGMAAAAMVVAHAQGLLELDLPVATYWPEFASAGKREVTVRQLLAHQAGLVSLDCRLDAALIADHDHMGEILARQSPAWRPGSRHGYHTLTLGWYQNELIRRVDPQRRSLGRFFHEEIAQRLGVEFYVGLPPSVPADRVATVKGFHRLALLGKFGKLPRKMVLAAIWPQSLVAKSVQCLPLANPASIGDSEFRRVEIPSANGIGQARALAKIYQTLASGGHELGLPERTLRELLAPTRPPRMGAYDAIFKIDTCYHLGFSRPSRDMAFGASSRAFGCPGAGGSFAMGDPDEGLGYAYVTNEMGFQLFDDPREKAVRDACYDCLAALKGRRRVA
jgi:CubicO group peptidase (beta-lactamase class C family)